jgi:hypothetical protein
MRVSVVLAFLSSGNADCAQAVLPLQQACASGFLSGKGMEKMKKDIAVAAKMCRTSGGGH